MTRPLCSTTTATPTICSSRTTRTTLLDYLATLVAKEYVLYNNPRAATDDFAEEMIRVLVRVRRHLLKRR